MELFIDRQSIFTNEILINGVLLKEVLAQQMDKLIHKNVAALVWKDPKHKIIGRGSGTFISQNLLLTCAHIFFNSSFQLVKTEWVEIYPKQSGKLQKFYRVDKVYIPKEFEKLHKQKSNQANYYDYALVKIAEKIESRDFIPLGCLRQKDKQTLAIYGYPAQKYKNISLGQSYIESVNQWGLTLKSGIDEISQQKGTILYYVSTLPGQSGSAIIQVKAENLKIVGVHRAGFQQKSNGNITKLNSGRLNTQEMIKQLQAQSKEMGAEMFRIDQSALSASECLQRGIQLQIKKKYAQAANCYRTALTKGNTDFKTYRQLGKCLNKMKKFQEAIQNFKKAINLNKDDALTHAHLGYALHQTKRYDEVIKQCRKAVWSGLNTAYNYINLGSALYQTKRYTQAIEQYRNAIKIDSHNSQAYNGLGNALKANNMIEKAIEKYRLAIKINPKYSAAYNNIGSALYDSKKIEDAIYYYNRAIQIDPNNSAAYYNLGKALKASNRIEDAIAQYSRAIQIDPYNSTAYYNLGKAFKANNRIEDAIAQYNKAIQIDKNYSKAYNCLGSALKASNMIEKAIDSYRRAIQINPNDIDYHFNLGLAYLKINNKEKARECFERCLSIDANYDKAKKQLHLLG